VVLEFESGGDDPDHHDSGKAEGGFGGQFSHVSQSEEKSKMDAQVVGPNTQTIEEARMHVDPAWGTVYRTGGPCLVAAGIFYVTGAVFSSIIGPAPGGGEQYLRALAGHATLSQINFALFALADLLFVPAALGLFHALKHIARNAMLIAAGLIAVFIVQDLAVTEVNSLTLVALTRQYAAATSDAARAAAVAAASYARATLPLATFLSFFVSSVGFLIVSFVMLKGVFRKGPAYLGIVATIAGIIGGFYVVLPVLAVLLSPCLVAFGIFLVLSGLRLFGLGKGGDHARAERSSAA
jgi:hypothetical protein